MRALSNNALKLTARMTRSSQLSAVLSVFSVHPMVAIPTRVEATALAVTLLFIMACRHSVQKPTQPPTTGPDRQRELQERLRAGYRVTRPPVERPSPAVLLVPGCSGFASHPSYVQQAEHLVDDGYVVVHVDYLAAHAIANACPGPENTKGESITVQEIAEYLLAAAADLRGESYVEANRIFAVGSSLGGGGVLATLSMTEARPFPLAAVAALYPLCRGVPTWERSIPVLLLLAGLDTITPPEICQELIAGVSAPTAVTIRTFPHAHHAFDAIELPVMTQPVNGPTVGYDPDAAIEAWGVIHKFLKMRVSARGDR
jgi:dienelactone hydrolase